jgi:thioredoxin 1
MITELTAAAFKAEVLEADKPVLVDFYADWCGPCQAQMPMIEGLAPRLGSQAKVVKVNIDRSPELADLLGIRSIPTLILFSGGKIANRFTGLTPARTLAAAIMAEL